MVTNQFKGLSMDITLKNYKPVPSMSQETDAYTADVYVDGSKAFYARNDGRGGSDMFTSFDTKGRDLLESAEAWAKTLPPIEYRDGDRIGLLDNDLESVISEIRNATDHNKRLRSAANKSYKKVQFFTGGDLRSYPAPHVNSTDPVVLARFINAAKNKGHVDTIFTGSLEKTVAIKAIETFINGDMDEQDRLDKVAEILIDEGGVDPELVGRALGIEIHNGPAMK